MPDYAPEASDCPRGAAGRAVQDGERMSRVIMQSPAGDEFYPVRVERSYFKRGDAIVEGDPASNDCLEMLMKENKTGRRTCMII